MMRAIIWKEFREQGLIGLTLMVLGAGILVAAATLADPPTPGAATSDLVRFLGAGLMAALLLSVTAGTVCGGALFAAERESGTMGFLESHPISRGRLWRAKLLAGALLVSLEVGFVLAVAIGLGVVETANWALAISAYAALAFVWGLYGSTLARTTLGSVGVAVPSAAAAAIFYYVPLGVAYQNPRTNVLEAEGGLLFLALMFVTPVVLSAVKFTRQDRERAANDPTPIPHRPIRGDESELEPASRFEPDSPRVRLGLKALLWLAIRQLIWPGLAISAFAVALGLSLLVDSIQPVLVWPALALAAGVLAGVTAFADEQLHDSARFWGERRLPLGRLWVVKIGVHAGFAVFLAILLMLPSAIRAQTDGLQRIRGGGFLSHVFRTQLFDAPHLGSMAWSYLALPLAYGFAAGHVCNLLFKKTVVAAGVAGLLGGTAAAFWMPSLLAGGTRPWQLWLPPVAVLITARLLLRAWSSDRLGTRAPLLTLGGGFAATLLVVAAGVGYRAIEIDDDPTSEDDMRYVAGLAPLEASDSGRMFRTTAERFVRVAQTVSTTPVQLGTTPRRGTLEERIANVPFLGWQPADFEVDEWATKIYDADRAIGDQDEPWFIQAEKAGREKSPGLYEHPLRSGTPASSLALMNGRRMGTALLVRGLQQQAQGRPNEFVAELRTALALSRSLRNGSIVSSLGTGNEITSRAVAATGRWLGELEGRPDLLREAIRAIADDDPAEPFDPRPHLLAERYVLRDLAKVPAQWLPAQLTPPRRDPEQVAGVVDLIGIAWNVPWERERTRRLLGIGFEAGNRTPENRTLIRGRPGSNLFAIRGQTPAEMVENDRQLRTHRRAVLLSLAIHLYLLEKGTAPTDLAALVAANYLPSVPLDPYDDLPFRYRVSAGEVLSAPAVVSTNTMKTPASLEPKPIPAGQLILWSVGVDRIDSGGLNTATRLGTMGGGSDLVFLVPMPGAKQ